MDESFIQKFNEANLSNYPEFYSYDTSMEMGLWILWITKEQSGIRICPLRT